MGLFIKYRWRLPDIPFFQQLTRQAVIDQEMRRAMRRAVLLGQRAVQERTPVGATGNLAGSIDQEITGRGAQVTGQVFTSQLYGIPVELGTRPHWAPIGPLQYWALRVLGDARAAYRIRWHIAQYGTPGQHMFREGFAASATRIQGVFRAAQVRLAQLLLGRGKGTGDA